MCCKVYFKFNILKHVRVASMTYRRTDREMDGWIVVMIARCYILKCRYKVSWWNFGFLKNVEKLKLWRNYECALLFYTGVATGRNMEPRCYGRWSLSVVVVLPLRISCWYCCGSRLLSTDLHLYMFLQIAVLLTPPVFEIHYLFALPQRIINSLRICGRRLYSVSVYSV